MSCSKCKSPFVNGTCSNVTCIYYGHDLEEEKKLVKQSSLQEEEEDEEKSVCSTCEGSGMIARLLPGGHTECACPDCREIDLDWRD